MESKIQNYNNDICLIMIVRDESHVIKRCLSSVINIIDSYLICDTGSEDDTPEIIKNYMKSKNIPGKVIYKEWKNFGFNKSYLMKMAHKKYAINAKYLIWLDADEVFLTNPNDYNSFLTKNIKTKLLSILNNTNSGIFYIETHYGKLKYRRWNIVRNNQLYYWEAPIHEYLVPTTPTTTTFIDLFILLARKEGSRTIKGDSNIKDIKLLEEYLKEKPNDPRTYFYLAQTYSESGNIKKAIELYRERMKLEGFYQEKYISALRSGRFLKSMNKFKEAIEFLEEGYKIVPQRLEIPYEIMIILKNSKKIKEAFDIGQKAYNNYKYTSSNLFIEEDIYKWKFLMEFSVIAYYSENYNTAYEIGQKLINEMNYPKTQAKIIEKNMQYFKEKINYKNTQISLETKFNFSPPAIVIIDNFLKNPDKIREFALNQEFTTKGNYPGLRTKSFATLEHKLTFEKIMGRKITYWPQQYNGSFQITTGINKSWIHRDLTDYSAIIYLTPNGPPNGGTLVYRHKNLKIERDSEGTSKQIDEMNKDSSNEDKWDIVDKIGYKYNRIVIFSGRRSHKSDQYFGSTKENGRLFQLFFFNLEK
jgi:tetratricopeptide (TPR) repeat protein